MRAPNVLTQQIDLIPPAELPDLAALVSTTPRRQLPGLVANLAAALALAAGRLAQPEPTEPDVYLTAKQVAARTGYSLRWVRKHGDRLPGYVQAHGRGTSVRWSRRALDASAPNGGRLA